MADLLSTLTVEAAVHHLDLVLRLDRPGPAAGPLAEVRRVLEGLLGRPAAGGLGRRHRGPPRHRAGAADRRRPGRARARGGRVPPVRLIAPPRPGTLGVVPVSAVPAATDVLVVGAGPAGSAAAAWAARAGHDVVLADAAVFPRDKTCGDGLTPRAIAELDLLGLGDWVRGHAPQPRAARRRVRPGVAAALARRRVPRPRQRRAPDGARRPDPRGRAEGRRRRRWTAPGRSTSSGTATGSPPWCSSPPTTSGSGSACRRLVVADGVRSPLGRVLGPRVAPRDRLRRGRPRLRAVRAQRRRVDLLAPRAARRARASCCPATAGSSRSARPPAR